MQQGKTKQNAKNEVKEKTVKATILGMHDSGCKDSSERPRDGRVKLAVTLSSLRGHFFPFKSKKKKKGWRFEPNLVAKEKKCLECQTGLNLLKHLDGPAPYKLEKIRINR